MLTICQIPVIHLHLKQDIFPHFISHLATMINRRILAKIAQFLSIFLLTICFSTTIKAADGAAIFAGNCASCHAVHKDATGPALAGVEERWGGRKDLYVWINNWEEAYNQGIPQAVAVKNKWKTAMNKFNYSKAEIDAVLDYIKSVKPPVAAVAGSADAANREADNSLLYGILTLILGIIALTLLYVNSNLRKMTDDKEGNLTPEPIPFYRNKTYLLLFALVAFIGGGFNIAKSATNLGRNKGYQPEQPIFYSHKVHAGLNQINCLYCHAGAQEGKQATIPSVNVCMNCHQNIKEYGGEPKLVREDGTEVNGTAEIKKLYEYAGFTGAPGEVWNGATAKATAIPWVKIHNLPDHVYFNHSQHVKVGQVACQKCHGEIQGVLGEVKQHSDLSMGWCINCHRETGVQFSSKDSTGKVTGNGFYEQYTKLHEQVRNGDKKATVESIGGTECQKCHY